MTKCHKIKSLVVFSRQFGNKLLLLPRKKLIFMENEIQTEVQTETQLEFKTTKCLNCGTEFEGKYCPECGQSANTGRFTPQFIFDNLRSAIIGNDGGIWYTFKSLFIRPGAMIVEILNGKRKKYFSPFPMLFFMLTVYILLFTLTGSKSDMQTTEKNHLETEEEIDPSLEEHARVVVLGINEFNRLVGLGYKFYNNHYTAVFMLTLPFFLFATRVFYGKDNRKRYFRTEYLVAIVYSMVMEVVYRCLVSIVYLYSARVSEALGRLVPLVIVVAFTACFHKMLGFSIGKTAWRSVMAVVLYYVILGTVLFIIGVGLFLYIILIRHKLAAGM